MAERSDEPSQTHVRFSEREELIPQPGPYRQDSDDYPRRGTYDSVESASSDQTRSRRDYRERPSRRSRGRPNQYRVVETVEYYNPPRGRPVTQRIGTAGQPAIENEPAILSQEDLALRLAESPTPLDDVDDLNGYDSESSSSDGNDTATSPEPRRPSREDPRQFGPGGRRDSRPRRTGSDSRSYSSRSYSYSNSYEPIATRRYYTDTSNNNHQPPHSIDLGYQEWTTPRPPPPGSNGTDDWDFYVEKFQFQLPSQSIAESSKDGESDSEQLDSEERVLPKDKPGKSRNSFPTVITSSQYTGNAELGGSHSAALTAVHGSHGRKQSLFRWLHVRQKTMDFEELWVEISRLHGLSDLEKRAMARLRADAKSSLKSRYNPKGAKVGYMEPRVPINIPLKNLSKKLETETTTGSARWMVIPYFSLEQYSGLLSASKLSLFPAQTLLQSQYSRSTAERDMEQAVCQLGHVKRGECFHISQLWCVVIDSGLLVTCGTMEQSDLQRDSLKINAVPSGDLIPGNGQILVSYGESVSWSFTADECQTWFAFLSKFQSFWPRNLDFWHKDQIITPKAWPRILRFASKSRSSVKIVMKLGTFTDPSPSSILKPEPDEAIQTQDGHEKPEPDNFLHVLMLPQASSKRASMTTQASTLRSQLDSAHEFLMSNTSSESRRFYKNCETSTRKKCREYLTKLLETLEEGKSEEPRRICEEKIDAFNAIETLYKFFLPADFEDTTSQKFWGAVQTLLTRESPEVSSTSYVTQLPHNEVRGVLRTITPTLAAFQNIMSHASEEERAALEMPREFAPAWLHAVMSMVDACQPRDRFRPVRMSRTRELVEQGTRKLMHWLPGKSLLERMSIMPLEVLSLLTLNLLQDQVGKSDDDICETYSQYLDSLENSIMSKPSDRSYQHRIDLVQQEMTAIRRTLWRQREIISEIRNSLAAIDSQKTDTTSKEEPVIRRERLLPSRHPTVGPRRALVETAPMSAAPGRQADDYMDFDEDFVKEIAVASKLSETDAGGLRGLFFKECSRLLEQRDYEFRRYSEYANGLERALTFKMNFTKDRQENAIFAFTLVTIIFLPISTVSSIFGMNTVDVRDMEASQWLYWAVAIPVTVCVILAGLWWMGELGSIGRWLMRKPQQSSQGTYGGPIVVSQAGDEGGYYTGAPALRMGYARPQTAAENQPVPVDYGVSTSMEPGGLNRVQTFGTQRYYAPSAHTNAGHRRSGAFY